MTLTILDDSMSSDHTGHSARLAPGHQQQLARVLAARTACMDRNSAITAMVLADVAGNGTICIPGTGSGPASKAGPPNSA